MTYRRLVAAGFGPASLEELLAGAPQAQARTTVVEPTVVDIRMLLYSGMRAQQRAQELRAEAKHATGERLRALVEEVCDLVALALEPPLPPLARPGA